MQEIERKLLVKALPVDLDSFPRVEIHQGYLAYEPGNRQVHLRRSGDEHWLTVKLREGMARDEVTIGAYGQRLRRALAAHGGTPLAQDAT